MSLELVWEEAGVVRIFSGTVTTEDVRNSIEKVHADIRFPMLEYSINDFLAVTSIDVSKSALANAAMRTIGDSHSNASILVAIVATQPEIQALAGFYSSPSYMPYPAKMFGSVEGARRWIADHSS
ncbi:MAG: hypothetical protein WCH60_03960 [Burkholderiales bacterium]